MNNKIVRAISELSRLEGEMIGIASYCEANPEGVYRLKDLATTFNQLSKRINTCSRLLMESQDDARESDS